MDSNDLALKLQTAKYLLVASSVFLVYDHVLNFDKEIRLVWSRRWTSGTMLYIYIRYIGTLDVLSVLIVSFQEDLGDIFCQKLTLASALLSLTLTAGAQIVLQGRIYAVYSRDRNMLKLMAGLLVLEIILTLVVGQLIVPRSSALDGEGASGCYFSKIPSLSFLVWTPTLILETILCFLMIYRAWKMYVERIRSPLLDRLVRDSIQYFLPMACLMLANTLIWLTLPHLAAVSGAICFGWQIAIPCNLSSALFLNLRAQFYKKERDPSSQFTDDTFQSRLSSL